MVMFMGASVHHVCAQGSWRPEEGIGSPRLKLQTAVSLHVGAGNWTQVLRKNSQC